MCGPTTKSPNEFASGKSRTVSPVVPSGIARRKSRIATTIIALVATLYGLEWCFKDATSWLKPAGRYCENLGDDETCVRSDLFAKQATSLVVQLYLGGIGILAWHIHKSVEKKIPKTPEGRLFGYLEEADKLNAAIFSYQAFDFFTSCMVPQHASPVFLAHHVLTALTAWMSLEYQMVHYYAIFFGGCSEISTIFLVAIDFERYFPLQDQESTLGLIILICQASFTLTFAYYRVIKWLQVSYQLWSDVLTVGKKGGITEYRPGKEWFLYGFLVLDVFLGSLQLYWFFFEIGPKVLEVLGL